MRFEATDVADVVEVHPRIYVDDRGHFFESFNARAFAGAGLPTEFVQDNQSCSARGVLRGLHYQIRQPQGKLVRCLTGAIWDVAVDIRRSSPTFTRTVCRELSAASGCALWIPAGFAHGFLALRDNTTVLYKTTEFWAPEHERCIRWDDPALELRWPLEGAPTVSTKDAAGMLLANAELFS